MRIDVIRIGDDVYFLTKQGQAICLSMKYLQKNCDSVVKEISNTNKISEIENFAKYASTCHNKRRLLRYKKEKFEFITQNNKKEALKYVKSLV